PPMKLLPSKPLMKRHCASIAIRAVWQREMHGERRREQRQRRPHRGAPAAETRRDDLELVDEDRLAGAVAAAVARRSGAAQAAADGAVAHERAFDADLIADADLRDAVAYERIGRDQVIVRELVHPEVRPCDAVARLHVAREDAVPEIELAQRGTERRVA